MHPDLGREQAYFDRARELRDRRRAEDEGEGFGSGAGSSGQLGQLLAPFPHADPDGGVAFGRIDTEGHSFYIGRDAVMDDQSEMVVVNWQTPVAAPFYTATAEQPDGLTARRVYRCQDDRILDIDELVFAEVAAAVAEDRAPVLSDRLLDALEADRSGELSDIVATIQRSQYEVITKPLDQVLVVQGGPGTGKTQVGLHRVSWMLHNHAERIGPGDVLVVGPNQAFVRYISGVLPALGEAATTQLPVNALGPQVRIGRTDPPELRRLKGDRRMLRVIVAGLRNLQLVDEDPVELAIGRRTVRLDGTRVAARARQLGTRMHNEAHRELRSFLLEEVRNRLTSRGAPDLTADPAARADATEAVDDYLADAWPALTPQAYLLDLLADPDLLEDAAAEYLTDDEMDLLAIPEDARVGVWQWSAHDVPLLDTADVLLNGAPPAYEHIVVDEAQDLSPMQLESIRRRSRTGSMTLLGDLAQATSPWVRNSWEEVALHLKRDRMGTEIVELETSYRLPAEVHEVAMRLLPFIAPNVAPPTPVRSTGEGVLVTRSHDLATATVETVRTLVGGKAGLAAAQGDPAPETGGMVGIVVPARHRARVAAGLERAGLPWAPELRGGRAPIVLLSADAAKGLEFDNVVVVEPAQVMAESERGLRSLFIAMTRCTRRLALVHRDPLPAELGTIDQNPPRPRPRPRPAPAASSAAAPTAAAASASAAAAATATPDRAPQPERPPARAVASSPEPKPAEAPAAGPGTAEGPAVGARPAASAPAASGSAGSGSAAGATCDPVVGPPAPGFDQPEVPLRWGRTLASTEGAATAASGQETGAKGGIGGAQDEDETATTGGSDEPQGDAVTIARGHFRLDTEDPLAAEDDPLATMPMGMPAIGHGSGPSGGTRLPFAEARPAVPRGRGTGAEADDHTGPVPPTAPPAAPAARPTAAPPPAAARRVEATPSAPGAGEAIPRRPVTAASAQADTRAAATPPRAAEADRAPDAYERRFANRRRYGDDRLAPGREAPGHDPLWASTPDVPAERPPAAASAPPPAAPGRGAPARERGVLPDGYGHAGQPGRGPAPAAGVPPVGGPTAGAPSWLREAGADGGRTEEPSDPLGRYGTGVRPEVTSRPDVAGEAAREGQGRYTGDDRGGRPPAPEQKRATARPAAPGVGRGVPADRAGWPPSEAAGEATGRGAPAAPAAGRRPAGTNDWSKEALAQVDSMQVSAGPSDRVPVDDPAPAWGAAYPDVTPATDWRTSIPREFVARAPVGAPARDVGRHDAGPVNGRPSTLPATGDAPAGPAGGAGPAGSPDPGAATARPGPGTPRVPGPDRDGTNLGAPGYDRAGTGVGTPGYDRAGSGPGTPGYDRAGTGVGAPGYDRAGTGVGAPGYDQAGTGPGIPGPGVAGAGIPGPGIPGAGVSGSGVPGYGASGAGTSGPGMSGRGDGRSDLGDGRPGLDDQDPDAHIYEPRSARTHGTAGTYPPRTGTRPGGPEAAGATQAHTQAHAQATAATAPRVNGVNGVNGIHAGATTGGELVLADSAGARRGEPTGPWNELDREIARAVAATLAGKLARYVNPNLLPLVAEELGRTISPEGTRRPDGGESEAGRGA